jgi:hypothetical protein
LLKKVNGFYRTQTLSFECGYESSSLKNGCRIVAIWT